VEQEKQKKINFKLKRNETRELYKGLEQDKIDELKNESNKNKKMNQINDKLKQEQLKEQKKKEFKQLGIKERTEIIKKIKEQEQFPHLEDLTEYQTKEMIGKNLVYIDPGKRDLLYMMDSNEHIYVYSNKQRIFETKRIEYQNIINKYKIKNNINEIENELTNYNSKECNIENFKKYIKKKNELVEILIEKYENVIFRKYKWYSYINRIRSEAKLLNTIEEKFGKNIIIIYGDWSIGRQMKNFISTPNIGLKRKIDNRFTVYSIDEYNTSKVCCKNEEEKCENIYLPDKEGKIKKIHAVLTYKMENGRYGCINRDFNSVNNMKKITEYWLKNGTRMEAFKRGKKIITNKKVINKKSLNEKKSEDNDEDNDEIIIVKPIKKQKRKKMIIKLL
jgi:hypothetical protein